MLGRFIQITRLLLYIAIFVGIERWCYLQTGGFAISKIVDQFPENSRWELPPISEKEEKELSQLLDQPFTLLAIGAECYAFESADGTVVMKVFKMHEGRSIYYRKVYSGLSDVLSPRHFYIKAMEMRQQMLERTFDSMIIAYHELKEETGLLTLHLNKTNRFMKDIILIDSLGNQHSIPSDSIRFVLQKKAVPVYMHLEKLIKNNQIDETKKALSSLIDLIVLRCKKGIADRDPVLKTNLAFLDNRAIEIDLGSFSKNPYLSRPAAWKKELYFQTYELKHWLEKKNPSLSEYFNESLMATLSKN